jgi:hypothetical protein
MKNVKISWNPSTDNVEVVGYNVFVNGILEASTENTFYNMSLEYGQYRFSISAFDAAGNESEKSEEVVININDTIQPSIPTGLKIEFDDVVQDIVPYGQDPNLYGNLIFQDEFDNGFDETKWMAVVGNYGETYLPQRDLGDFEVRDGALRIWPVIENGNLAKRTIFTYQRKEFLHGYFEVEAKLPRGVGVWPAIWLYAYGDVRPEIDILEAYGMEGWMAQDGTLNNYQGTVWNDSQGQDRAGFGRLSSYGSEDLSNEFHTYGCRWDSGGIQFYFDGQPLGDYIQTTQLNKEMFFILWLWYTKEAEVGVTITGEDNPYVINYVRVWELK